jgi:hypothetical protein
MKLGMPVVLAMALLLASPPMAWAQRPDGETGSKASSAARSGAAATKKDGARKSAKAKAQTSGVSPAARSLARRTKSVFIYAAESCARAPKTCDATLRDDAETRFLDACGRCNTSQRCEAERDAVRAGTTRASQDPCAP